MLSTQHINHNSPIAFLPAFPSPLSPRSANIYGPYRDNSICMSDLVTKDEHNRIPSPIFKVGDKDHDARRRRNVKKAPSPKQDDLKERRRSMFLRNVREKREDKRFEARGEDMIRLDFMQRQRAWEAQLAREGKTYAPKVEAIEEEEEYDLPTTLGGTGSAMDLSSQHAATRSQEEEADELRRLEDEELEAMLEMMPARSNGSQHKHEDGVEREMNLWSDDDDYDALFSEAMGMETASDGGTQSTEHAGGGGGGDVDMDMS